MRVKSAALAVALLMLAAAPAAATTTTLPATPMGEYVTRWLQAINDPDPREIGKVDPHGFPLRVQSGGLDLVAVEQVTDTEIVAEVVVRLTGRHLRASWTFEPGAPPRLKGWRGVPVVSPNVEAMDDKALSAYVGDYLERADFSGAVLIARDGKPVFTAVRGLADREAKVPNTLTSRFRVGSMDKMFTAVAILQLAQAGKVRLDAPVGEYLKGYANGDVAKTVTVWQLLTHTGGVGDIFGPQFDAKRLELKTLSDYVAASSCWAGSSRRCRGSGTRTTSATGSSSRPA